MSRKGYFFVKFLVGGKMHLLKIAISVKFTDKCTLPNVTKLMTTKQFSVRIF